MDATEERRHGFDLFDLEDTEIRLPPIQIIVGAEILRQCMRPNRAIEHSAQCHSIDNAAVNRKANDPCVN
jgi:hypothetical protein